MAVTVSVYGCRLLRRDGRRTFRNYLKGLAAEGSVLASSSATALGQSLQTFAWDAGFSKSFRCLDIRESIFNPPLLPSDMIISHERRLDSDGAALVIFTSGTTGPPKGVVQRRLLLDDGSLYVAQQMHVTENDTILHVLPVHHATGAQLSFFPFLLSGACIEFRNGSFDPGWVWNRLKQGDITFFSGVPTIYTRMMRFYQETLAQKADAADYVQGARRTRNICGTSALPHFVDTFWTNLLGHRIIQRYGSSESGVALNMPMGAASLSVPDGSVGEKAWGADVKLTTEGEILVKNIYQFAGYLNDPEATANAFSEDGYFKTGDIARNEGKYYWIMGRASVDILKSGGYKISALDVERELLALPYIHEAMVVGVEDEEFGQRVAAVVSLFLKDDVIDDAWRTTHSGDGHDLTLTALRRDLSTRLAGYKMPTLLKVIKGSLTRTASGKVIKKELKNLYFPLHYTSIHDVQVWRSPAPASAKSRL
ncbi:hypothetical protein NM208_g9705 [Fusarium decemcellulare]|uniref:Uncharacterized protein n=1 Tax=Fusarium decemcellulare TaxID=57161 RepID=A0ACC1S0J6_9HYPO|nr:hypothetical protein NM208_g9705 [Fusarium decemcellulare]